MNIRPLEVQDERAWAALLATCFDRSCDQTRQMIGWFQSIDTLIAWGAWDNEHLAAQYACLMRYVAVPGYGRVRIALSLNMAVHPDYRGLGLIKKVAAPVYDAARACGAIAGIGFSNAEGVQVDRHSKGYGYQVIGRMQSMIARVPVQRSHPAIAVLNRELIENEIYLYGSLANSSSGIHFDLSTDTLQRRFRQHPFRRYHYHYWYANGLLRGWVVYRPINYAGLRGVSLLAASSDDLSVLFRYWLATLDQEGYRFVHLITTPYASHKQALSAQIPLIPLPYSRSPFYLTTKSLCADLPPMWYDFNSWDCIGGDIL